MPVDDRKRLESARADALDALDRLFLAGQEGDMVTMTLGKNGKVHVKGFGRSF